MSPRRPVAGAYAAEMLVDTPILILGVDEQSMHHGALGIVRSAGQLGISVFLAHAGPAPSIGRSRYSAGRLAIPAGASAEQTLEILREFSRPRGPAQLIPVDDTSAMFVADHADALQDAYLFPRQPVGLVRALASKREMNALCLEHGIPTPAVAFPQSEADVRAHARDASFPLVAKRIDGSLPSAPDAPSVAIAQSETELLEAYRLMESPASPNVMLQEYIPGGAESIWMLNGYFDARSDCLLAFTGQKIRQSPPYTGATTLGVCRANAEVEQTTRRFMKAIGYRGILDTGYRYDSRDGQYKLLDVNPRIGATFRLFVGDNGMDVLRAQYLDLTGQPVPASAQLDGRHWLSELLDVKSSATYVRRGDLSVASWLRSLRGVDETAWWAREDPLPFLVECRRLLADQLRKRLRRATGRRAS